MPECLGCEKPFHRLKTLTCGHSFCKECLDGLLGFGANGGAIIRCPLKCRKDTHLQKDQTTNDLSSTLGNSQTSSAGLTKSESLAICQESMLCQANINKYCSSCHHAMCNCCCEIHKCEGNNNFFEVKFHPITKQLKPFCIVHQTFSSHFCLQCNEFVCLYCKQRTHKSHKINKTFNLAKQFEEKMSLHKASLERKVDVIDYMQRKIRIAGSELNTWRELLLMEIKNRKLKCVYQYMDYLQNHEDKLIAEFDQQVHNYNNSIHDVQLKYSMDEDVYKRLTEQQATNSHKPHFQRFLQANQLNTSLEGSLSKTENPVFPNLDIHFDQMPSFESNNPDIFGVLDFKVKDVETENVGDKSVVRGLWENCDMNDVTSGMAEVLKQHPMLIDKVLQQRDDKNSGAAHSNKPKGRGRRKKNVNQEGCNSRKNPSSRKPKYNKKLHDNKNGMQGNLGGLREASLLDQAGIPDQKFVKPATSTQKFMDKPAASSKNNDTKKKTPTFSATCIDPHLSVLDYDYDGYNDDYNDDYNDWLGDGDSGNDFDDWY